MNRPKKITPWWGILPVAILLALWEEPPGPHVNRLKGAVLEIAHHPPVINVCVGCGNERIAVEVEEELWDETRLQQGDDAFLILPLRWIKVKSDKI